MDIANKTVLITGANRGIGRALVDEILRRGAARVYAGTRTPMQHHDERVSPIWLDVTSSAEIRQAADEIDTLDILINNAGVAIPDDLSDTDIIERHLAVNLLGGLRMSLAFLPHLERSKGSVVNTLSLAAIAPLPVVPAYSISKAAAHSMTQTLRMFVAHQGVTVHGVFLGPVDTEMTRGFDIPKTSPALAAAGVLDGLERGEEDIFPDPASEPAAQGWRIGIAKVLEGQFAALMPETVAVTV